MINLPNGKNVVGLKWIFKTKYHADGIVQNHNARRVANGYSQQWGVDFEETFSLFAQFETVKTLLALATQLKWPIYQLDVKVTFLNVKLENEVYIAQPKGFAINGKEEKVYKLKKAFYGLKQEPRAWYSKIDSFFQERGFERSKNEPTLYLRQEGNNDFLVVCLYVDDIIYMGLSHSIVAEFKSSMISRFEMTYLSFLHYFLGLEVKQGEDGVFVSQKKYALDLLKRFGMVNCKVASTPMNVNEELQLEDSTKKADARIFRSLVGGLIFFGTYKASYFILNWCCFKVYEQSFKTLL